MELGAQRVSFSDSTVWHFRSPLQSTSERQVSKFRPVKPENSAEDTSATKVNMVIIMGRGGGRIFCIFGSVWSVLEAGKWWELWCE